MFDLIFVKFQGPLRGGALAIRHLRRREIESAATIRVPPLPQLRATKPDQSLVIAPPKLTIAKGFKCPKLTSEWFNQGGSGHEKSATLVHQPRIRRRHGARD
jgi:hypothetical protein